MYASFEQETIFSKELKKDPQKTGIFDTPPMPPHLTDSNIAETLCTLYSRFPTFFRSSRDLGAQKIDPGPHVGGRGVLRIVFEVERYILYAFWPLKSTQLNKKNKWSIFVNGQLHPEEGRTNIVGTG